MKKFFSLLGSFANSWTGTIIIVLSFIFFVAQAFIIPSGSMLNTMLIGDNLLVKKFSYGIPTPTLPWLEVKVLPDFNNNGHLITGDTPKRGDIVIFRYPLDPKIYYVKRNVAISGDEVLYTKDGLWIAFSDDTPYKQDSTKTMQYRGKTFYYDPYMAKHKGVHYTQDSLDAFLQLDLYSQSGEKIAMTKTTLDNGELAFYKKIKEGTFFMMGDNRNNSNDSRFWDSVEYKHVIGKPWFIYLSFDDNFNIRWDRIGKSIESLEEKMLKDN
ncbi:MULTISPECIES: signal peptidase I [Helicobacter]|uniref:Signal peptidase I n=1 Tax=Helicobacter ibis TaxID=2962633 RepID=A0ABT4VC25_9HELI|nr:MULTISPECIES: signal peptidase I [Helicobacter]MDA3967026.1 signal peptidase I [Helicobacter sp. WB40]MDA3968251.1 signal peptidase I [Helicobacter ibis]